jgi:hypothetical protein
MRHRLDIDLLDARDPFELDMLGNVPHLFKHGYSVDDVYDVWSSDPTFFEGHEDGPADWLMVAEVPGGDVLVIPLAPPNSGDPSKTRPIGIQKAPLYLEQQYRGER